MSLNGQKCQKVTFLGLLSFARKTKKVQKGVHSARIAKWHIAFLGN